ncbi:MAG TPA: MoxR family ATPase [Firmicutes bacterium]|nr:MoxR family ATPase [Bacillota bacterium]
MNDDLFSVLADQQVNPALIEELCRFRQQYPLQESQQARLFRPPIPFYGREILEMAIAALLRGENLLLSGSKATGKNVLADNLSYLFGRPSYTISFNVNTDSASLIGTDTFQEGEVRLRKGPVFLCAQEGGFGILDEINMAKNDAVSVLHATLDYRRIIDVPGYERIALHPATRFIGTMNHGYAGTRELNEALVSRFLVIDMPDLDEELLTRVVSASFPSLRPEALRQFCGLFLDLQTKAANGEISTKPLDLRGLLAALGTIQTGLTPSLAVKMGITNKCFDQFEGEIVDDVVLTRIPSSWTAADVFDR